MAHRNIEKNRKFYRMHEWGEDYFSINAKGHVTVCLEGKLIDLYEVIQKTRVPVIMRFEGILRDRIGRLCRAFENAIDTLGYRNAYRPVYPLKVNPKKDIVEAIKKGCQIGLEVGSKAELLAAFGIEGELLICNGFKDVEFIELALLSEKKGHRPILVVEQPDELELIVEVATRLKKKAEIGFRMMPLSSSGMKMGLTLEEIEKAVAHLKAQGKLDWVTLCHFHPGTEISSLATLEKAHREAGRIYAHLAKLCPALCLYDVGGGLAISYGPSVGYTMEEYAKKVVSLIQSACDKARVPHPAIITESGRAAVAECSVLITEVVHTRDHNRMYVANFSIFQSLPDAWGIHQIFPIMPIHRLDEIPTMSVTLADLTCDADGKIDRRPPIRLHKLRKESYYIGIFLVGAYQEILGSHHNLFGATPVLHIDTRKKIIEGDTMGDMLCYMGYNPQQLAANTPQLRKALKGSTYLS